MSQRPGYLTLHLHAHLPFVRHPECDSFLEETWLFEAMTESYLPLLQRLDTLAREGIDYRLSLVLSPPLVAMLDDALLRGRYQRHLDEQRALVAREAQRRAPVDPLQAPLAYYHVQLAQAAATWQAISGDVVGAFAAQYRQGRIDLLACAATHGYLPLLQPQTTAVWAQVKLGIDDFQRRFGESPSGFWLPECAYYPELDALLPAAGVQFVVVDAHGLPGGAEASQAVLSPIRSRNGLVAFGRDRASAYEVWSRERGYPADAEYREFYRDLSQQLSPEQLGAFYDPAGFARTSGIKCARITGPTEEKALYRPERALDRAKYHAGQFVANRIAQALRATRESSAAPLIVAAYDAELFGHWWHEGPVWLECVLRGIDQAQQRGTLATEHLSGFLRRFSVERRAEPLQSSWGVGGYHQHWLNPSNAWIYPELHAAAAHLTALAGRIDKPSTVARRALNQGVRELLLAQSSDWAFLISAGTAAAYATRRVHAHLQNCRQLCAQLELGSVDHAQLQRLEQRHAILPAADYRTYRGAK